MKALRIVHVFRAPLGGLFRHVLDLSVAQAERGHRVGLVFDSGGMNERVEHALSQVSAKLSLGVMTLPIPRSPGPSDLVAFARIRSWLGRARPDVVHGHGSKGGLYARLNAWSATPGKPIRAYTPHGGSFHYRAGSLQHFVYMTTERTLARSTDVFLFESGYIKRRYDEFVGIDAGLRRQVPNGLRESEFKSVTPNADATDLLYIGELRSLKGVDTLLDALPAISESLGYRPSLTLVGSGPDRDSLQAHAQRIGFGDRVSLPGPLPAREAFKRGRVLVVPSRAESLPYVVLEAAAARVPLVATDVGGIPEIFGPFAARLGPCDDPADLARRIVEVVSAPAERRAREAGELCEYVRAQFSIPGMAEAVLAAYREALTRRARLRVRSTSTLQSPS